MVRFIPASLAPFGESEPISWPYLRASSSLRRRNSGGGEVALGIAFAAEVKVILPGPQKAAAIKVPLDPADRTLQHLAHLAGLGMAGTLIGAALRLGGVRGITTRPEGCTARLIRRREAE